MRLPHLSPHHLHSPVGLAALLLMCQNASAVTIRVPAQQPTIQHAINAAANGDTVLVAPGTYNETLHDGFLGKSIVVRSEAGPAITSIRPFEDEVARFSLGEGPAAELNGFTIRDGYASGLQILNSSPTIRNCVIRDCSSASRYGPVAGGGIVIAGGSPLLIDCVIANNRVIYYGEPPGYGALGGGLYCSGAPTLIRCSFSGNEARGAYIQGDYYGGSGGAIYSESSMTMINCTLYGNTARLEGGGVFLSWNETIENTIIAFSQSGGALACWAGASPTLSCSDLFGNTGGDWVACAAGQLGIRGNISADPVFCDAENGQLTLHQSSPCAPENSPGDCGLIGAWPVACGVVSAPTSEGEPRHGRLRVNPNPASLMATFAIDGERRGGVLEIYNTTGRLLEQWYATSGAFSWRPAPSVPNGLYIARLHEGSAQETLKFLLVR